MPLTRSNSQRSGGNSEKLQKPQGHDRSPSIAHDSSLTNSISVHENKRTREESKLEGGKRRKLQGLPSSSPSLASTIKSDEKEKSSSRASIRSTNTYSSPSSSSSTPSDMVNNTSSFTIVSSTMENDAQGLPLRTFTTAVFHPAANPVYGLTRNQQSQAFTQSGLIGYSQQPQTLVVSATPSSPPSSPLQNDSGRVQCQCGKSSYYMYAPKTSVPSPPRCVSKRCPCFASGIGCVNCRCRFCENPQGVNQIRRDHYSDGDHISQSLTHKKTHKAHKTSHKSPQTLVHQPVMVEGIHPLPTRLPNPLSNGPASSDMDVVHPLQLPPLPQTLPTVVNSLHFLAPSSIGVPSPPSTTEINWIKYRCNKSSSNAPVQKTQLTKSAIQTESV